MPVATKQVVAVARGLYDVTFVPVSREPHRVSVTFNEQAVPGSPFVCRVSEPHTFVQVGECYVQDSTHSWNLV